MSLWHHAERSGAVTQPFEVDPLIEVEVTDNLARWRAEWDALVLSAPVPSPFLRSWWLEAVADQRPTYVLVVEGGVLIGGLALKAHRRLVGVPIYRFAGSGVLCPDHLDLVSRPDRTAVVTAMVTEWLNRPGRRLIDLQGVVEHSVLPNALSPCRDSLIDGAPWEALSADFADGYLATRSANFRRSARRSARKLADAGVRHRHVASDSLPTALEAFRDLQQLTPGREALLVEFPRLRAAVIVGVGSGEVRMDVLETDDHIVAVSISFVVAGRLSLYQTARTLDSRFSSAATVLHLAVIAEAAAQGCLEVDLLRGLEPYKTSYASRQRKVIRVRAARGLRADLVLRLWLLSDRVRPFVGRLLRRLRSSGGRNGPVREDPTANGCVRAHTGGLSRVAPRGVAVGTGRPPKLTKPFIEDLY
jgi:CelD/BcsL family acetyltransferase involved in cellulose biosynthesis